jgi:hypothetical protein
MKAPGQRFLMIYSGVLTAVFVVTVASGFVVSPRTMTLDQLDVQRINLREPDGTLRMVMTSQGRAPGVYLKGKEFPHPMGRKEAGFLFLNAEGTENGGLSFGGEMGPDGVKNSNGHLSFDAYEQDQTMSLGSGQHGKQRTASLQFVDYPDYSLTELMKVFDAAKGMSDEQRNAKLEAFFNERGRPTPRMTLNRGGKDGKDDGVTLTMADTAGHPRIVMKVAADGSPSLEMLDSNGKVVGKMVPTS